MVPNGPLKQHEVALCKSWVIFNLYNPTNEGTTQIVGPRTLFPIWNE